MATYFIKPRKNDQFTVSKNGKVITTGDKRFACQRFVHFNAMKGQEPPTTEELRYFENLSQEEVDAAYPVGTEISL